MSAPTADGPASGASWGEACEDLRPLLVARADGAPEGEDPGLEAHLAVCDACRADVAALADVAAAVRGVAPAPGAAVWRAFDDDLRAALAGVEVEAGPGGRRRAWLGPALAAAALLGVVAPLLTEVARPRVRLEATPRLPAPSLELEPRGWQAPAPGGIPPLAGLPGGDAARAALGPRAHAALARRGLVQVDVPGARSLAQAAGLRAPGDGAAPAGAGPAGAGPEGAGLARSHQARGPAGPRPLATVDASLALVGAAAAEAALALERDVLAPGLRALLDLALGALRGFAGGARDPAVQRALARARAQLGVAALLVGVDPRLPPDLRARAEADAARARAARAPGAAGLAAEGAPPAADAGGSDARSARSATLDAPVDWTRLAPAGPHAAAPDLDGHARAVAWLVLTAPRLDLRLDPRPGATGRGAEGAGALAAGAEVEAARDEVRAGALVALALAHAQEAHDRDPTDRDPAGRPALGLAHRLEAAVELLYGPPDGLGPLEVLACLREGLGRPTLVPDDLGPVTALEAVAARARLEAAARARGRLLPSDPGDGADARAPLVGAARGLEAGLLVRLGPGAGRSPTGLDALALLGSRRARAAILAGAADDGLARGDAPRGGPPPGPGGDAGRGGAGAADDGLARALEALRRETPWRDPRAPVSLRASLEQARLWTAAALVEGDGPRAPWTAAGAYRDRALLAACAALVPQAPGRAPGAWGLAPDAGAATPPLDARAAATARLPAVEPAPEVHHRLAFTARRLARALGDLAGEARAPGAPPRMHLARAIGRLEAAAALEEALRDAAAAALAGRPAPASARAALAGWADAVRRLAPDVRVADPLWLERAPRAGAASGTEAPAARAVGPAAAEEAAVPAGGREDRVLHRVVARPQALWLVVADPETGAPCVARGPALLVTSRWAPTARLAPEHLGDEPAPRWASHVVGEGP